jgi:hypothetical protein
MRTRLTIKILPLVLLAMMVLAPVASAHNDGRGFYGATDDKVVTDAGFILIFSFPVFVLLASMLQNRLDKRKKARVKAQKAHQHDARWQGGW